MANLKVGHVQHAKSNRIENGKAKLPTPDQIEYGEIAINYAADHETISIKNSNNSIVTFLSSNQSQEKLESGVNIKTINGETLLDSGDITIDTDIPMASSSVLGGIKVGNGLTIDGEGVLSSTGGGVADSVDWSNITSKPSEFPPSSHTHEIDEITDLTNQLSQKQDKLVSGTNIKTINGNSLLGSGNLEIETSGGGGGITDAPSDGKKYVRSNANWVEETKVDISDMLTKTEAESTYAKKTEIPEEYVLPKASSSVLGGIKVGAGLSIDGSGILSATGGGVADSVNWENVVGKPDIVQTTGTSQTNIMSQNAVTNSLKIKQDTLVSGTNIKTINGQTILGSGNIEIQGGGSGISDAPSDGKKYVRSNGNWVQETKVDTSSFATKSDISDMATMTWVGEQNFLTSIPSEYITESELTAKNYATETWVDTNYAKKSDIGQLSIPIASSDTLGGIKVGAGLSINSRTGVLSATGGGVADSVDWSNITSKPSVFPPSSHTHVTADITDLQGKLDAKADKSHTHTVANITDLTATLNKYVLKSDIKTTTGESDTVTMSQKAISDALDTKSDIGHTHNQYATTSQLNNYIPTSSIVQTTGQSTSNIMSQKAVSDEISDLKSDIVNLNTISSSAVTKVNVNGSGNAVTSASISSNVLTLTKGTTFLTSIPSNYVTDSELANYISTSSIVQVTGTGTTVVMSQKAVTDELNNKSNNDHTHSNYVPTSSIVSTTGTGTTVVMSQKAVTDELNDKSNTGHTHSNYSLTSHTHTDYLKRINGDSITIYSSAGTTPVKLILASKEASGSTNLFTILPMSDGTNMTGFTAGSTSRPIGRTREFLTVTSSAPYIQASGHKVALLDQAQTWTAYQDFTSGAGNSGSDMRFKEVKSSSISDVLDKISDLKIFPYKWTKEGETQWDTFGVDADQLFNMGNEFSTMVHERDDKDKTKFVDYDRFGLIAIKAIQELMKKINILENKIKVLENKKNGGK